MQDLNGFPQQSLPEEAGFPMPEMENYNLQGGMLKVFPDNSGVVMDEAAFPFDAHPQKYQNGGFHDNIAHLLSPQELRELGLQLKDEIDEDFKSQEPYISAVTETIKQIGFELTNQGPAEGAAFKHASGVVSVALLQTVLELTLNISSFLFSHGNIVDTALWGDPQSDYIDRSEHVKQFANQYFTYELPEFRAESETTVMWGITCGDAYAKIYEDPIRDLVVKLKIPIQNFAVHRDYSSPYGSVRKTHLEYITPYEFKLRKNEGYYLDTSKDPLPTNSSSYEGEDLETTLDYIRGIEKDDEAPEKNEICMSESHVFRFIDKDPLHKPDGIVSPYRISLNRDTGIVYAIFRNWAEDDPKQKESQWFSWYGCMPAFQGAGYGLAHWAGNQGRAATLVTRQIMDAALYANFPAFFYQQGLSLDGNNLRLSPGTGIPIPLVGNSIQDSIMKVPFEGPDQSMYNLKKDLEDSIRQPAGSLNPTFVDMNPNAPVATTLALIEGLQKVPNAILQKAYDSFSHELELFRQRWHEWLRPGEIYKFKVANGDYWVTREDFAGHIRLVPTGDPSTHNSSYRLLRAQMLLTTAQSMPEYHNMQAVLSYYYKCANIPDDQIQAFVPMPQEAPPVLPLDPLTENVNIMTNKPVVAGLDQNHEAHIISHGHVVNDPNTTPEQKAAAMAHIQQHQAFAYLIQKQAELGFQMPQDPSQIPPEMQNEIAVALAQKTMEEQQPAPNAPPAPIDPALVGLEEVKMQGEIASMKNQTELLKIQGEREKWEQEFYYKEKDLESKREIEELKLQLAFKKLEMDSVNKEREHLSKELDRLDNEGHPEIGEDIRNLHTGETNDEN
jgi:hypothetical protein